MAKTKFEVTLSDKERKELQKFVRNGKASAKAIRRANILLASDTNAKSRLTVAQIAAAYSTSENTVIKVRKDFVEKGATGAVTRKKRETPPVEPKIDCEVEAHILEIACSEAPEGYDHWTVRMISERCVELGYIDSISHTSVATVLKKAKSNRT